MKYQDVSSRRLDQATMAPKKEKFATQIDPELLAQTRAIAIEEGRQIQSVMNGVFIRAEPHEAYNDIIALYESGSFSFEPLEIWLRANT